MSFVYCVHYDSYDVPVHAVIHRAECSYANRLGKNLTNWSWPFRTSYEAWSDVTKRYYVKAHPCEHCRPFDK